MRSKVPLLVLLAVLPSCARSQVKDLRMKYELVQTALRYSEHKSDCLEEKVHALEAKLGDNEHTLAHLRAQGHGSRR